jgi:hypothetical protein
MRKTNSFFSFLSQKYNVGLYSTSLEDFYASDYFYETLGVEATLAGHEGCVNALSFNYDGTMLGFINFSFYCFYSI